MAEWQVQAHKPFPEAIKFKIRTWYLVRGLSPKEIAEKLECDPKKVRNLVSRSDWHKEKLAIRRQAAAKHADKALSVREAEQVDREAFRRAVVVETQDLALAGFAGARKAADREDGKEFSFFMQGAKTAVQLERLEAGLAANGSDGNGQQTRASQLAVIYARFGGAAPAEPKRVDPEPAEMEVEFA